MNYRRSLFPSWLSRPALLVAAAVGLPCAALAQSLSLDTTFQAPVFTLSTPAGRVLALSNGQFLVYSGENDPFVGFDRLNGAATGNLLRFNADGTRDNTFVLDPALRTLSITSVAAMANGQYIVAAYYNDNTIFYGQVYRLNANGSVDTTFVPSPPAQSSALFRQVAVQADGKVLAGGTSFGTLQYNGVTFNALLRLNTDGSVDTGFNIALGGPSNSALFGITTEGEILVLANGQILVGGGFTSVNGVARPGIVRLNADGTVDTSFVPSGFSVSNPLNPTTTYPVRGVAVQSDGKIVLTGRFNRTSTSPRPDQALIRLNADGSIDTSYNAPFAQFYDGYLVRLQADDKAVLSDISYGVQRFNTDGTADTAFNGNVAVGFSNGLSILPNGQILTAGQGTTDPSGVTRLNTDGTRDASLSIGLPQADAPPQHVALRSDGTILASGNFDTVAGRARNGLALLNPNGSLNAATVPSPFLVDTFDGPDFLLQSDDNKILLFGNTPPDAIGNLDFTYLRLNADLSVDNTLAADASVAPFARVLYQPGGGYLLSAAGYSDANYIAATGGFPGDPAFFLHRLGLQGSPDANFTPAIDTTTIFNGQGPGTLDNATIYDGIDTALAVQADGKILFQYFDNTEAYRLIRLNPDGSLDSSFQIGSAPPTSAPNTGFTPPVDIGAGDEQAMAVGTTSAGISGVFVQTDGRILIYGDFAQYNGQPANGFARLNANGSLDTTFNDGAGPQGPGGVVGSAYAITNAQELPNGQLLLVGSFQTFNGVPLPGIARLNANGTVDTTFTASGVVSQQASIGTYGGGAGSSRLAPEPNNGTYLLTGNYTTTSGVGAGTFFRLFGGVATTPTPVTPVVPGHLPSFFNGAVALSGGFYYLALPGGNVFGYYNLNSYPYLYHSDLGFEYVIDANDGNGGIYLYDFASRTFFYTSPGYPFPYLYDFTLKTVLYYFPDAGRPGHYTSEPRYFYNFATGKIITK